MTHGIGITGSAALARHLEALRHLDPAHGSPAHPLPAEEAPQRNHAPRAVSGSEHPGEAQLTQRNPGGNGRGEPGRGPREEPAPPPAPRRETGRLLDIRA
ncbi:MAG: hypothetical protein SCH98_08840 [Deferrisomatales bacterium]|nr:hypothetical protein [Deferrisomatales bacterium]